MITLYTFGPAFGLPDPSPFVTKAEVLLKMAGLSYRTDTNGLSKAPKGKLPYIDDDGGRVADSTFIRWHIEKKYGSLTGGGKFLHYKDGQRREGTFSHQPANGSSQSGKLFDAGKTEFLLGGFDLTTATGQGWIDPAGNGHKYDIGWSLAGEVQVKQKK